MLLFWYLLQKLNKGPAEPVVGKNTINKRRRNLQRRPRRKPTRRPTMPHSKPYRTNRMTLGLDLGRKTRFQGYPASRRESTAAASRKCCELGKSKRLGRIAKLMLSTLTEFGSSTNCSGERSRPKNWYAPPKCRLARFLRESREPALLTIHFHLVFGLDFEPALGFLGH